MGAALNALKGHHYQSSISMLPSTKSRSDSTTDHNLSIQQERQIVVKH